MHIAVVAIIGAAVAGTTVLSSAVPGNASVQEAAVTTTETNLESITARYTQSNNLPQVLDTELKQQQAPSDNLLMAVLSLEASKTSNEVEESKERIVNLAVPQESPPIAMLKATEPEGEGADGNEADAPEADEDTDAENEDCADTGSAAYCIYTVEEGDTLSVIAQNLGFSGNESLSAAEMLAQSNRPDILSSDHIEPGQNLRIPRERGIVHTVLFSENASEIASDYGVPVEALLASPYNAIDGDGVVLIGQEVFVPDPNQLPVNEDVELTLDEPTPEPTQEPEATEELTEVPTEEPTATPVPEEPTAEPSPTQPDFIPPLGELDTPTPEPTATPEPTSTPEPTATPEPTETPEDEATEEATQAPVSNSRFIWPTSGPISSYFGPSHPLGIDIDLFNEPNAPIVAARGGTLVFAGGDPCCSYGYYVIIDHGNGVQTLYAHFSRLLVDEGEVVSQGELIGYGGRTGNATGNHLHFEIRVDGNVVDPMRYLP